ncbi:MAG: phospholipid carrier-dependent glycosyltransferase [Actinomycetota bacterium]
MTGTGSARRAALGGRHDWTPLDGLALALVTIIGGGIRLVRLGDPPSLMFDETYYAKDACLYAGGSERLCGIASEQTQVHPPLGKWFIAAGVDLFGYESFGWRIAGAVAGTATIALLYLLARKVLRSTLGATVASGLLAFDLLHFVQSRIAMLDVFVTLFGVAAVLLVTLDRDRLLRPRLRRRRARPWRSAAGLAAGAAAGAKWSGVFFVVAVLVLTIAWEVSARRGAGIRAPLRRALREEGPSIVLSLVALPLALYCLTFAGRLDGAVLAFPWSDGSWLHALWERHLYMYDFHSNLEATHPYQSPAWSWLLLKRPVSYFFETTARGDYMEIVAVGSPLVWWSSIAALIYVGLEWLRSRDMAGPEGLILTSFIVNYVPWLLPLNDRSAVFLFYLLPAVPFMCLAIAYVPARFLGRRATPAAAAAFCAAAVALFAFYYPLVAKVPIARSDWLTRIWIFDNCARPPPTETAGDEGVTAGDEADDDEPPEGWCWI